MDRIKSHPMFFSRSRSRFTGMHITIRKKNNFMLTLVLFIKKKKKNIFYISVYLPVSLSVYPSGYPSIFGKWPPWNMWRNLFVWRWRLSWDLFPPQTLHLGRQKMATSSKGWVRNEHYIFFYVPIFFQIKLRVSRLVSKFSVKWKTNKTGWGGLKMRLGLMC